MEQRLIDANAADVERICCYYGDCCRIEDVQEWLDDQFTIDAVPVVHGRWVKAHGMMPPEYHGRKCCSVCDAFALMDFHGREQLSPYCPNCGAKMDLE